MQAGRSGSHSRHLPLNADAGREIRVPLEAFGDKGEPLLVRVALETKPTHELQVYYRSASDTGNDLEGGHKGLCREDKGRIREG